MTKKTDQDQSEDKACKPGRHIEKLNDFKYFNSAEIRSGKRLICNECGKVLADVLGPNVYL